MNTMSKTIKVKWSDIPNKRPYYLSFLLVPPPEANLSDDYIPVIWDTIVVRGNGVDQVTYVDNVCFSQPVRIKQDVLVGHLYTPPLKEGATADLLVLKDSVTRWELAPAAPADPPPVSDNWSRIPVKRDAFRSASPATPAPYRAQELPPSPMSSTANARYSQRQVKVEAAPPAPVERKLLARNTTAAAARLSVGFCAEGEYSPVLYWELFGPGTVIRYERHPGLAIRVYASTAAFQKFQLVPSELSGLARIWEETVDGLEEMTELVFFMDTQGNPALRPDNAGSSYKG